MITAIIAFAAGVCWVQLQASLPSEHLLFVLGGTGSLLLMLSMLTALAPRFSRFRHLSILAACLLGIAWAGLNAHMRLADSLNQTLENQDVHLVGVVASLPQQIERGWRFEFDVEQAPQGVPKHISLAWYDSQLSGEPSPAPQLHAGERWQVMARLKRPHGNLNPHGFDFEAWLFQQNIRATGYVRNTKQSAAENVRLDQFVSQPSYWVEALRENLRDRFLAYLPEASDVGVLIALTVGDQRAIPNEQWRSFARTGITHLVSISGLHITMLAGLAYMLTNALWRRSTRLLLLLPAQQVAAIGGFLCAFAYCLLAGFAVPAQRTLYMLGVVAVALIQRRQLSGWRILTLALLVVLLLDPWAVLSIGFWLSFSAVGLLFYIAAGRLAPAHWFAEWGRAQWVMTLGMIPAMLALFQQFSLVSPIANAVAIPVVSFIVTPLALLATLPGCAWLLWPAHWVMSGLLVFIEYLADLPWAVWALPAPPDWAFLLALIGTVWLFLPRGFPLRWLGLLTYLPLFLLPAPRPSAGEVSFNTLDVGQGLAVHVQTATHDLLFDTGPGFSVDTNSGNRIILPYLQAMGVERLHGLIVSHVDTDHSGGTEAVVDGVDVDWMLTSAPFENDLASLPVQQFLCAAGQRWEWDGVSFEILYPYAAQYAEPTKKTNDMSCVLKVSNAWGSGLITADIEARSEAVLLANNPSAIKAELLWVPHHGSRTSSMPEFITAVGAKQAIFTVGYLNRYKHPRPEVVARYVASNAELHRSDEAGAIFMSLQENGYNIRHERGRRRRYWHGQ